MVELYKLQGQQTTSSVHHKHMKYNSSVYIEHGKSKNLIDVGLEIHDNKQARNKRGKKRSTKLQTDS